MNFIQGLRVHIEPPRPRYVLPADVPPPPGMTREEFDAWSRRVCGYGSSLIPDGQVLSTPYGLHMNQATFDRLKEAMTL